MIAENMPFDDYRSAEGINASAIKKGRVSMLHMNAEMNRIDEQPTAPMIMGTHIHTAVLEPERFADEIVVWNGKTRRGKEWDKFRENHERKTILTPSELETLMNVYEGVKKHPEAIEIIQQTQHEVSMFWDSPELYGKGKARMDMVTPNEMWADLKSTAKIHPREFQSHAERMGYFHQAGWSAEGMEREGLVVDIPYYIIAVETTAPFDCVVYEMPFEDVMLARIECKDIAVKYALSAKNNEFEGVAPDGIQTLTRPDWATPKLEI